MNITFKLFVALMTTLNMAISLAVLAAIGQSGAALTPEAADAILRLTGNLFIYVAATAALFGLGIPFAWRVVSGQKLLPGTA